jgi:hypothetical protein
MSHPASASRIASFGTTIFTEMSALAIQHNAVNLGQGFPDFEVPVPLREALARAMAEGKNQYAHMAGVPVIMVPDLLPATPEIAQRLLAVAEDLHQVSRWLAAAA